MATPTNLPHPLLQSPVLYVFHPSSNRIKWSIIKNSFKACGPVTQIGTGKSEVQGNPSRHMWTVSFISTYHAEMALATLQGQPFAYLNPPVTMVLSHSPTLEEAMPSNRLFPQYVKADPDFFLGEPVTAQLAFRYFRNAGPIASLRVDVDIGDQQRTVTIEYFKEEHAKKARQRKNNLHSKLRSRPKFTLTTYDPCSLHCSGFGPTFLHKNFVDTFVEFGDICGYSVNLALFSEPSPDHSRSAALKNIGQPSAHGIVTFASPICGKRSSISDCFPCSDNTLSCSSSSSD
ncbi:hypothetical protein BDY19DRAFT_920801 [Irpex rosettiformis]|uniref:Uncharacterized protein n=1 Tax=Irpex rosettiformis TaxID=378272 RepID=A0ACB8UIM1_9APHY|nr:hypothetical protein BDY19DRAFT_920801 [Irpex rosettiformis]